MKMHYEPPKQIKESFDKKDKIVLFGSLSIIAIVSMLYLIGYIK